MVCQLDAWQQPKAVLAGLKHDTVSLSEFD